MIITKEKQGVPYTFHITKRRRQRRIVMRPVRVGEFRVSTPLRSSRRAIERVIDEHLERLLAMPIPTYPIDYEDGDTMSYFGQPLTIHAADVKRATMDGTRLNVPSRGEITAHVKRFLTASLRREVMVLVRRHEGSVKRRPLKTLRFSIRPMKSKFGSCRPTSGRITLNLELIHYPKAYLEMIFLHEVAHLDVADHQDGFYRLMDRLCPEHRVLRKALNRLRQALLYDGFSGLFDALKEGDTNDCVSH